MPYSFNPFSGKLDYYEIAKNTVVTVSADYTLGASKAYFSTIVVTAAAEIDLPVASPGMITRIYSTGANVVIVYPAAGGSIVLTGTDLGVDVGIRGSGVAGDFIELFAKDSTTWVITSYGGTWSLWDKYATITVTSPNGGEYWNPGSTYDITWDYTGTITLVKIELIQLDVVVLTISASTPCDGTYSWAIPGDITEAANYKVRITAI